MVERPHLTLICKQSGTLYKIEACIEGGTVEQLLRSIISASWILCSLILFIGIDSTYCQTALHLEANFHPNPIHMYSRNILSLYASVH